MGKIQGWKQNTMAGNEILIKAVAQAISTYPMNIFRFPATGCGDFDSLLARFWWGEKNDEKKKFTV